VTCADGDITVIVFESNNLKGTIPSSLGSLTELTSIGLGMNEIHGSIPSSIGQLTGLTTLWLAYNLMTGPVPPLPFAQYTGSCLLEDINDRCQNYGQCNNFSCPLPPHADQCTAGGDPGVRC
jgi:Leucine-rich repeat (LRR) protein